MEKDCLLSADTVIKFFGIHDARTMAVLPVMLAFYCSSVEAAEWTLSSSINQSLSYNDNFRMTEIPQDSVIYRLTPTLNFARKTEVWDIVTDVSYGIQSYSDTTVQDQNPQNYGFNTQYKTGLSNLGLSANYSITPTRNTAEQDSGNFNSNAERENWSISPSYSYQLTGRDSLIGSASYTKSTYSTTDFNNSEHQTVSLGWQRQWTGRISYSISPFYTRFKSDRNSSSINNDSYGINLSTSYSLSKLWQLNGTIGGRITDTTIENLVNPGQTIVDQNMSEGFLANLTASYTNEKLSSVLGFSHSLVPSAQGQLNVQTLISFDLSNRFSRRLSSHFMASYRQTESVSNNSLSNTNESSRTNINFSTGLDWQLARDWILSMSYQYRRQERKSPDTITADSNTFMLTVNYIWSDLHVWR
jgi:predicted porin